MRESWELIHNLAATSNLPWYIIGDFNDLILRMRNGGQLGSRSLLEDFTETIIDCGLVDLGLVGGKVYVGKVKRKRYLDSINTGHRINKPRLESFIPIGGS